MKQSPLGIKQVSLMVVVTVLLLGGAFFLGQQIMNGRFSQSPRILSKNFFEKLKQSQTIAQAPQNSEPAFKYDFFSLLQEPAPKRELAPIALETNPALLAKKSGKKTDDTKFDPSSLSRYAVQVSSFQRENDAKALAKDLQNKGYRVGIVTQEVPNKGTWYKVCIDGGKKRKKAEAQIAKIEKNTGLKGFVVEAM